jgi:hypothetical protein
VSLDLATPDARHRRPLKFLLYHLKCKKQPSCQKAYQIWDRKRIAEILLHGNYEETALEKLAREVALRPVHQTDPGKLAREVDVRPDRDNALVPDQKEHRYDGIAV